MTSVDSGRGDTQAQAARVLADLLGNAAVVALPPAWWTVHDYRPQLSGQVTAIHVEDGEAWCDNTGSRAAVRAWGDYLGAPVQVRRYRTRPARAQVYVHTRMCDVDICVWAGLDIEDGQGPQP